MTTLMDIESLPLYTTCKEYEEYTKSLLFLNERMEMETNTHDDWVIRILSAITPLDDVLLKIRESHDGQLDEDNDNEIASSQQELGEYEPIPDTLSWIPLIKPSPIVHHQEYIASAPVKPKCIQSTTIPDGVPIVVFFGEKPNTIRYADRMIVKYSFPTSIPGIHYVANGIPKKDARGWVHIAPIFSELHNATGIFKPLPQNFVKITYPQ